MEICQGSSLTAAGQREAAPHDVVELKTGN
jgi:hypothetical protein